MLFLLFDDVKNFTNKRPAFLSWSFFLYKKICKIILKYILLKSQTITT